MAGGRKIKCVTSDPRWRDMVIKYRYNFTQAVVDIFGMFPSHQQQEIIQSVQQKREQNHCYLWSRYREIVANGYVVADLFDSVPRCPCHHCC